MGWKTRLYDVALSPFVALATFPMRAARRASLIGMPITRSIFMRSKVFPLVGSYYEPLFDTSLLDQSNEPRQLPGIDFEMDRQRKLLAQFDADSLPDLPHDDPGGNGFFLNNSNFSSGDAELWFHVVRHFKPARIIEIGSGHSTRMARLAVEETLRHDPAYTCAHTCIEPYEMPWLEQLGIRVIREKVEDVDLSIFGELERNDILFIDSSHIIRPQGDVLKEYLEILPTLAPGVIVHIHDIFSPREYPKTWLNYPRFWNEQYLLEAFLSHNDAWEVLLGANQLKHGAYDELKRVCRYLQPGREPGSFYLRRRDRAGAS